MILVKKYFYGVVAILSLCVIVRRIRNLSSLALKVSEFIDLFKLVSVTAKVNTDELKLATFNMPPLERGESVEVPLWMAVELVKSGVATLDLEKEVTWLGRVHWRENVQLPRGALSLSAIPTDFYPRVKMLLHFIKITGRVREDIISQAEEFYREIVKRRTHIVAELSFMDEMDLNLRSKLTEEELILLSALKEVLKTWARKVHLESGEG